LTRERVKILITCYMLPEKPIADRQLSVLLIRASQRVFESDRTAFLRRGPYSMLKNGADSSFSVDTA
jgi:hypothetical protein